MHIPLDVSDYTLDDLIKEFGRSPVYSKVFDTKEDRTFLIEFESLDIMNEFVTKYNNYEIADGFKVTVELFEQKPRKQKRNNTSGRRVGYGSHYQKHEQPQEKPKGGRARKERLHKPTLEELDAQLAAYMNSDSKEASESSQEPK